MGAAAIRARGGTTITQTPADALFRSMPTTAIEAGVIDHEVRAADVGRLLTRLADREIEDTAMEPDTTLELENRIAMGKRFSTSFDKGTRPAIRIHLPRLQRFASGGG